MPDTGTSTFTLTRDDAIDAERAYLHAANELQELLDTLTFSLGLVVGVASHAPDGQTDRDAIDVLRWLPRDMVAAAEKAADAIWELTGPISTLATGTMPDRPPRGPQMDNAAFHRRQAAESEARRRPLDGREGAPVVSMPPPDDEDTRDEVHHEPLAEAERARLDVTRDEVIAALRWIAAGRWHSSDSTPQPAALDRATQLGWATRHPGAHYALTPLGRAKLAEAAGR